MRTHTLHKQRPLARPAADWEPIISASHHDSFGNAGAITTTRNRYVSDIYEDARTQWWCDSTGQRGRLIFDPAPGTTTRCRFTPAP